MLSVQGVAGPFWSSVSLHPEFFDGFQTLLSLSLSFILIYPPCSLCWGQNDSLCDFLFPKWK